MGEEEFEEDSKVCEVFCDICPNSFHTACLGPHQAPVKGRWVCGWHTCSQCRRSASGCGGMLLHCLECASALCYECFPPNFRRVYPPDDFWTDMQGRGWHVTPKKMIFLR